MDYKRAIENMVEAYISDDYENKFQEFYTNGMSLDYCPLTGIYVNDDGAERIKEIKTLSITDCVDEAIAVYSDIDDDDFDTPPLTLLEEELEKCLQKIKTHNNNNK